MKARLATAAVGIPILLWLILGAPLGLFRAVVLLATLVGLAEYFRMAFPDQLFLQGWGLASGGLVAVAMVGASPESPGIFLAALIVTVALGLIAALFFAADPARGIVCLGYNLLGILYVGAFLPHLVWLRVKPTDTGAWWVLAIFAIAMAGDTAAYFCGRALGRHLLFAAVSPNKTVEGAIGAIGGNLLGGAVVKIVGLPGVTWREMVLLSLVAGILAQLGDLCESLLKRAFRVKDSGNLLPGHGGILDRADSLVFPTVLIYYYVNFFHVAP